MVESSAMTMLRSWSEQRILAWETPLETECEDMMKEKGGTQERIRC